MSEESEKRSTSDRRTLNQRDDRRQDDERRNHLEVVDFERRRHHGRRECSRRLGPRRQD